MSGRPTPVGIANLFVYISVCKIPQKGKIPCVCKRPQKVANLVSLKSSKKAILFCLKSSKKATPILICACNRVNKSGRRARNRPPYFKYVGHSKLTMYTDALNRVSLVIESIKWKEGSQPAPTIFLHLTFVNVDASGLTRFVFYLLP